MIIVAVIVGGVIVVLVAILIIIVAGNRLRNKRNNHNELELQGMEASEQKANHSRPAQESFTAYSDDLGNSKTEATTTRPTTKNHTTPNSSESYIIDYEELEFDQEVGRGAFGIVYRGTWRASEVAISIMA